MAARLCTVIAFLAVSCSTLHEDDARSRVSAVLDGLGKSGGDSRNANTQTAVCMWARGTMFISDELELSRASDAFTLWANEKGIFRKFSNWEITNAASQSGEYGPEVIVSVKVEGRPLKIRVIKKAPLGWVD